MATKLAIDYEKELLAPVDWSKAKLAYEGDTMAYIGIEPAALTQVRLGSLFRCYYAPSGSLKQYRLVLFEAGTCFDKISKLSSRCYYVKASRDFAEDIWGMELS